MDHAVHGFYDVYVHEVVHGHGEYVAVTEHCSLWTPSGAGGVEQPGKIGGGYFRYWYRWAL